MSIFLLSKLINFFKVYLYAYVEQNIYSILANNLVNFVAPVAFLCIFRIVLPLHSINFINRIYKFYKLLKNFI